MRKQKICSTAGTQQKGAHQKCGEAFTGQGYPAVSQTNQSQKVWMDAYMLDPAPPYTRVLLGVDTDI